MPVLPIKKYPDPVLRTPTELVTKFDSDLKKFIDSMFETMYHGEGVGLAAPQVGISKRIAVLDVSDEGGERIEVINPQIVSRAGKVDSKEGCLSIPGFRETIERSKEVVVQAFNVEGKEIELKADGLLGICLQHEIDHLDGVLFVDHLSRLKREIFKSWLKKNEPLE